MKTALLALFFLLFSFSTKAQVIEPVLDSKGNPLGSGELYKINYAAIGGGGVNLAEIVEETCPLSVVLDVSDEAKAVVFTSLSGNHHINRKDSLEINFAKVYACAVSSKWIVRREEPSDFPVVIGKPDEHPVPGHFQIQQGKAAHVYKLVFCSYGEICESIGIKADTYGNLRLVKNLSSTDEALQVYFERVYVNSGLHMGKSISYE